jgi:NAD(P)-dependent dehydrogenase (short-subunit alcohol dehydrogenase family)
MAFALFDLAGQVAIVTGSSRGIARAIVERLAEHGARVAISSRSADACEAVARAINDRHGPGTGAAIPANISSKEALEALVTEARTRLGPISILVCNAAANPYYGPMRDISDAQFHRILENNIVAEPLAGPDGGPRHGRGGRRRDHRRVVDRGPPGHRYHWCLWNLESGRHAARPQPCGRTRACRRPRQRRRAGRHPNPILAGSLWRTPSLRRAARNEDRYAGSGIPTTSPGLSSAS